MTRINVGINPMLLTDEHLLAEHREIKRVNALMLTQIMKLKRGEVINIPNKFSLGKGHVLFFMDKYKYTHDRYMSLHNECLERCFNVENYSGLWDFHLYSRYIGNFDWEPTESDTKLLIDRITERINESKKSHFRYYGFEITKEQAIALLNLNGLNEYEINDSINHIMGIDNGD